MVSATNVDATAVNTISWLSSPGTTIVVPVYQRQYRWDIGGCEQLLGDIRAVGDTDAGHTHFIGSILSTANISPSTPGDPDAADLVLIDGQQRITTLMLLIAALHHTVRQNPDVAGLAELDADLARVLVRENDPTRTKLRPHRAWAEVFEDVVLDRRAPAGADDTGDTGGDAGDRPHRDSRFDDNYAFFRSQIRAEEVPRIWRGLQKLEHVAITLGANANAQQIFESLNSTGEPLRDHELIHNYVLMGLSHDEQNEIENDYWLPIEENTGEFIASFWRHYLVMITGREVAVTGERGVYDAFRQRFPRLELATLRAQATEWREYSAAYSALLDPSREPDPQVARQLAFLGTFGRGMFPLAMRVYLEYSRGEVTKDSLIEVLELIQSLLLRRTVVGLSNDRLVARLCRAREEDPVALVHAVARIMPSDDRVKVALKFSELPHVSYVLGRIAGVDPRVLDIEHVVPLAPSDAWSGDGIRIWADYSDDEQNSHRALAQTLGNLALLERPLADRALDQSFPAKRTLYALSEVPITREVAGIDAWSTAAIADRTVRLTEIFLRVWARPAIAGIDDDGLTPVLDAVKRRGWPRNWEREFEYVEYRGEHWEVYDIKYLFNRIFKRLWADSRTDVVAFSARRGGPLYETPAWTGHWDQLDDTHWLYMGWDSRYMLTAVQGVLDEAGLAAEVFVKYSYVGQYMK